MSMFNWQAPKGDPVLSSRFWIYWAVTVPLTLTVFLAWLLWYRGHQKHDTFAENMQARVQQQGIQNIASGKASLIGKMWYPGRRSQPKTNDEEKQAATVIERSGTAITDQFDAEAMLRQRVPTVQLE